MKKSIALHFVHSIYVKENPDTNLLSTSEKVKVKIYLVSMIPFAWRIYLSNCFVRLKKVFKQSDNLKWYFNKNILWKTLIIYNIITINKKPYILLSNFKLSWSVYNIIPCIIGWQHTIYQHTLHEKIPAYYIFIH